MSKQILIIPQKICYNKFNTLLDIKILIHKLQFLTQKLENAII